ncbi:MAG: hypothetical protein IT542_05445 [Rubellimicrobium sp.]|nr:hypothetical protein [Rubellimicrobium sp.]
MIVPAQGALADAARLDDLFDRLAGAGTAQEGALIAAEIGDELMRTGSPTLDLLLRRGAEAVAAGDDAAAIEHLTAVIDHAPEVTQAWHLRSIAYLRTGHVGPAIHDLGQALALEPRHFAALAGLAAILEEMGRPGDALRVWQAALAINPADADIGASVDRLLRLTDGTPL